MLQALKGRKYDVVISFLEGMPLKAHSLITDIAERNYSWVHCDLDIDRYEKGMFFDEIDELKAYNQMTSVVCVSMMSKQAFLKRFSGISTSVGVIYNFIDIEGILQKASGKLMFNNAFTIIVVGRLTSPKKTDRVIRLAARLKKENKRTKIQLIGDGPLRGEIERQVQDLGVEEMVDFLGFIRNPYPYIKAADLLLSTSGHEGFSLVVGEAMTLGTPVVATKTAGPMEILGESEYGLLCEHDDESIYQAVVSMIDSPQMRENYSRKGKERVAFFDVASTMEKIYKL